MTRTARLIASHMRCILVHRWKGCVELWNRGLRSRRGNDKAFVVHRVLIVRSGKPQVVSQPEPPGLLREARRAAFVKSVVYRRITPGLKTRPTPPGPGVPCARRGSTRKDRINDL
jgi:hypothetical protein